MAMPKGGKPRAYTCRKCGKPGHNAQRCTKTDRDKPAAAPKPKRRHKRTRARTVKLPRLIAGAADTKPPAPGDFLATARESAKTAVRKKVEEELAWAREYVAELERLVAAGA